MTKINLQGDYVRNQLESIGNLVDGVKVQLQGPDGKTKWMNVSFIQLQHIAEVLANTNDGDGEKNSNNMLPS